jgi:hypothetical protein
MACVGRSSDLFVAKRLPERLPDQWQGLFNNSFELTAAATVAVFHRFPFSSGCETTRTPTLQRYNTQLKKTKQVFYILFTVFLVEPPCRHGLFTAILVC